MNTEPQQQLNSCPCGHEGNAKPAGMAALLALPIFLAAFTPSAARPAPGGAPAKSEPIPMGQIGAVAGKQYQGDGLSMAATPEGARLRCVFQKLEGQATPEGLWLTSTTDASKGEWFRVVASAVGRRDAGDRTSNIQHPTSNIQLDRLDELHLYRADNDHRLVRPWADEPLLPSIESLTWMSCSRPAMCRPATRPPHCNRGAVI